MRKRPGRIGAICAIGVGILGALTFYFDDQRSTAGLVAVDSRRVGAELPSRGAVIHSDAGEVNSGPRPPLEATRAPTPFFRAEDFASAAYGNPYRAAIDARALQPQLRDSVYAFIHSRCMLGAVQVRLNKEGQRSSIDIDSKDAVAQALVMLESRCQSVWQDMELVAMLHQAMRRIHNANVGPQSGADDRSWLQTAPLDAWGGVLIAPPEPEGSRNGDRYYRGRLWGGLKGRDQYNQAVAQAITNITLSPSVAGVHLDSLIHCAQTGGCGIPVEQLMIHKIGESEQSKILHVITQMHRDIAAGNYSAFERPAHQ